LDSNQYDLIIIGAGTAGIPCAIAASKKGAKVLLLDKADDVGGTLHTSGGHMSAAGTKRQAEKGIIDHAIRSYDGKSFYIHPIGFDGDTLDFLVNENNLEPDFGV
jgi:fumarate reductase flavoprotein subunit